MKTFEIRGGDIHPGKDGFVMVRGDAKLRQDLACALIEPLGNDRFHDRWGSLLPLYIGTTLSLETDQLIKAEVYRVVSNYAAVQQREIERDTLTRTRTRFVDSEIIQNIESVQVGHRLDVAAIRVALTTRAGNQVVIVRQLEG